MQQPRPAADAVVAKSSQLDAERLSLQPQGSPLLLFDLGPCLGMEALRFKSKNGSGFSNEGSVE